MSTGPLGPDAATLDREAFAELLAGRRGAIKSALMDQRLLAGVGNLLSDDTLWRARVDPSTPVAKLVAAAANGSPTRCARSSARPARTGASPARTAG